MSKNTTNALTRTLSQFDYIPDWANSFYRAKKAEGLSPNTLAFYRQQLGHFIRYCDAQLIQNISDITPNTIREFLLWHEETGHNPGGLHVAYRVLKTFLRWYEDEAEPEGWKNPIRKVKPPKLDEEPLDPVELETVDAMVKTCAGQTFYDLRDRAVLLCLLDTGARAREFLGMNLEDLDLINGEILIRRGKWGKPRYVFIEKQAKRALRAYLKKRNDRGRAIWVTDEESRLEYGGLRAILEKRAELADVEAASAHSFRRACAIRLLRRKVDLMTIARILGHSNLRTLKKYLKLLPDDIREAYRSAVDIDI